MSLEFFGQFLLRRGELDEAQLGQALALMEELNPNLGELAVQQQFASEADCRRVHGEQRRRDLPFGELAMRMGVLNAVELEELLVIQQRTRVDLAKALVELGHLPEDRVLGLLEQWKSSQDQEAVACAEMPAALRDHPSAELGLQLFERLCLRVADLHVKVAPGRELAEPPEHPLVASIGLFGARSLRVTLLADPAFGERLARGLLGIQIADLAAELALDAVGEFLNVWIGNAVATLAGQAVDLRLEPPAYGVLPSGGWVFDVVSESDGAASIVLEPIASA